MTTTNPAQTGTTTVATVALIVGVIALLIALVAFNRTDRDENSTTLSTTPVVTNNLATTTARAQAATELAALRARLAAEKNYEEAQAAAQATQEDLAAAYANATGAARAELQVLNQQFDDLETQLRGQSADALLTLENLITKLRQDVAVDEAEGTVNYTN